jgi:hypothetical protein
LLEERVIVPKKMPPTIGESNMRGAWIVVLFFGIPALFIENETMRAVVLTICGCIAVFGPIIERMDEDRRRGR